MKSQIHAYYTLLPNNGLTSNENMHDTPVGPYINPARKQRCRKYHRNNITACR